jgi:hypothetical protein
MNKLETIEDFFNDRKDIYICKDEEIYFPERGSGGWINVVKYWVAPKKGIYDAPELQKFMMTLIPPDLEPTEIMDFPKSFPEDNDDGINLADMYYGRLIFDEWIGCEKVIRLCTMTDDRLANFLKFHDGKKTIEETKNFERRIIIQPFPSYDVMDDAKEKNPSLEFRLTREEMDHYRNKH